MLDDLESDVDKAQDNMEKITKATKMLIKESGGCKMFAALVTLTLILVVLIILVIVSTLTLSIKMLF